MLQNNDLVPFRSCLFDGGRIVVVPVGEFAGHGQPEFVEIPDFGFHVLVQLLRLAYNLLLVLVRTRMLHILARLNLLITKLRLLHRHLPIRTRLSQPEIGVIEQRYSQAD